MSGVSEEYFFSRISEDRPVCIPGHGQHLTGLGHVEDLAVAMAQIIGRDHAKGQVYNIQVRIYLVENINLIDTTTGYCIGNF